MFDENYYPPPQTEGGWRVGDPEALGVDVEKLKVAVTFHNNAKFTQTHGGALVIIYKGHLISESYVGGTEGGPRPWTPSMCNDMKSSAKSVFGTAVGVFLDEYKNLVTLDSDLVGKSREDSLIPQIWDQPLTDERKKEIKVKHVLSMTSGHEGPEPWLAPNPRHHYPGYTGSHQMYEYCFGWWHYEGIPSHHTLLFNPGQEFNYSSFGLEQFALAMRNITGEMVGPWAYERFLKQIGMPPGIRDNQFREVTYRSDRKLNFSHEPGWGAGGSEGCNAYGADRSHSQYGYNTIVSSTFPCTSRDYARLGYLWLRKGRWKDQQLVPEDWIKLATSRYVRDDGETPSDYGYTFWILDEVEGVPNDAFGTRGNNMNDCFVVPSLDLVVVRQGNNNGTIDERQIFRTSLIQNIVTAFPENP
ncbi:MAG: serine hydrolase [Candidatus Bathyarchaeota archaeon]|nr:serine hydrolase [Candidatus Bathyarchaeota archaeon]